MLGTIAHLRGGHTLNNLAFVHHQNVVTNCFYGGQIVADEHLAQRQFTLELFQ